MRVLVTGRDGQVARSLAARVPDWAELVFAGRPQLNLADPASVKRAVAAAAPDVIVSAAAYTAVDLAEDEPEIARAVNADGVAALGAAAMRAGAPVIHLSTDYVFNGTLDRPYREDDPFAPLGVYGRTKWEGEEALRASGADHAIVRTAWVYSPFGRNFVRTMLRLAIERDAIDVVDDQVGNPTSALDLAAGLFGLIDGQRGGWRSGTWHLAGMGEATWASFARQVLDRAAALGAPTAIVRPIATADRPTRAARPANSRLDSDRFATDFGHRLPDWRSSLDRVLSELPGVAR